MFSADHSHDSFEDEKLVWKFPALDWVKPAHLSIPNISSDPLIWGRSMYAVSRLDYMRSPKQKLECLTMCIKWLAKMLQVKAAVSGFDADTSLSALIYVVLRARPRRLRSNLAFIEAFIAPDKLVGESIYCLTQFNLAVSYINETLSEIDQKTLEDQMKKGIAKTAKAKKHTTIHDIINISKLSDRILGFCTNKEVFIYAAFVSRLFRDCCKQHRQIRIHQEMPKTKSSTAPPPWQAPDSSSWGSRPVGRPSLSLALPTGVRPSRNSVATSRVKTPNDTNSNSPSPNDTDNNNNDNNNSNSNISIVVVE